MFLWRNGENYPKIISKHSSFSPLVMFHDYHENIYMYIALVKALFSIQKYWYFSYFSTKTYVVGTH